MNEVKHIHLGRQQFTVSAEAYGELKAYLDAISKQSDAGVAEEVELRMAELLTERGCSEEKVVLPKDVTFLKEQLGEPKEFKDENKQPGDSEEETESPKRLYRDTDNGMVAGVAAGLGSYFNIDAVIIRLLFIITIFFGGAGVVAYIILWLLVPEARTASERLQMQGKAVTVDSLRQVVDRADVPGAARRTGRTVGRIIERIFKVALGFVGVVLVVIAAAGLLWTVVFGAYTFVNGVNVAGQVVFPVGANEVIAFLAALALSAIVLLTMLLVGIAMIRRRWQLPAWGTATLVGLFIVAIGITGALSAGSVNSVRNRVLAMRHTAVVSLSTFNQADFQGKDVRFIFIPDSKSYVEYKYFGNLDRHQLSAKVVSGTLMLNTGNVSSIQSCNIFCIYGGPDLEVRVHTPDLTKVNISGSGTNFISDNQLSQTTMSLNVAAESQASVVGVYPAQAMLTDDNTGSRTLTMTFGTNAQPGDGVNIQTEDFGGAVDFNRVGQLNVVNGRACSGDNPFVFVLNGVQTLQLNGKNAPSGENGYNTLRSPDQNNLYNCIMLGTDPSFIPRPGPWLSRKPFAPTYNS